MPPETTSVAGELSRTTLAIIGGRAEAQPGAALNPSPVMASAFHAGGEHDYARRGNPTWEALENAFGALEGGIAVAFSSGMAAAAALLEGLPPTARVVMASSSYVEVRALLAERVAAGRLAASFVDPADHERTLAALEGADLLWLDSVTNPLLEVTELDVLSSAAHAAGAIVVVDATLATPMLQRPLALGADLVLHSAAKAAGGHSDLLLGLVVARGEAAAVRLRDARAMFGAVPGTMEAWLALRGLRTLPLRIERSQRTATLLAERLANHDLVSRVHHPSDHRLLDGPVPLVSFEVAGGGARAAAICRAVRLIAHAGSLGGVETVIDGRWQADSGVPAGLLRVSVGCEDAEDLWRDLSRALAAA